mgnify:CR=1 FL=1
MGVAVGILNGWGLGLDVGLLAVYLALLYTALFCPLLVLAGLGAVLVGRRPGRRAFVAGMVGGLLVFNALLRFQVAAQFVTDTPHMTLVGAVSLVGILACGIGAAAAVLADDRRRRWRRAAAVVGGLALIWVVNTWQERPLYRDLATLVPSLLADTSVPPAPAPVPPEQAWPETRLVVLGFDGLSWEVLLEPLRSGELPGFRALLEDSAYGYVDTLPKVKVDAPLRWNLTWAETLSPVIWETISTGKHPAEHGIGHFYQYRLPGISRGIWHVPTFSRGNGLMGLRIFLRQPPRWKTPWQRKPMSSADARMARFYEVAERNGVSVGAFNWMNTGPAVPLNGFMRGKSLHKPRYYPPEIVDRLPPVPAGRPPKWYSIESTEERERYERVLYDQMVVMGREIPVELMLYYTHFHDGTNHHLWKREGQGDKFFFAGVGHPELDPSEVYMISLRLMDDIVADVLARAPDDAIVMVLSDHGFDWRQYKHHNAPPGLFIARGPGIEAGHHAGATVYDIAPTLLHWLGLPVADDMPGSPLSVAIPGGPLDGPVLRVATHGSAKPAPSDGEMDPAELQKLEDELRALGYLN